MTKCYGGIDIGKHASFACRLNLESKQIEFPEKPLANEAMADWFATHLPASICIDGPPKPNQGTLAKRLGLTRFNTQRRVAEFALQIYGCYGTPDTKPRLEDGNGWMANSMDLFSTLADRFDWSINFGDGVGQLLETHPTYGFRSLLGLVIGETEGDVQQLIVDPDRTLAAKRPRKAGGHAQRIELLQQSLAALDFPIPQEVQRQWESSIDYVDATLCALMALWRGEKINDTQAVGDATEGAIYIARPNSLMTVSPTQKVADLGDVKKLSSRVSNSASSKPSVDPPDAVLMRLGKDGPGGLTQAETIELAITAYQQGDAWLPIGTNHKSKLAANLKSVNGRFYLAFASTLRLRVTTGEVHFEYNGSVRYPGDFNPWPIEDCTGWVEMLEVEEVEIAEFATRQKNIWKPGFSNRGSNLLFARIPR